MTVQVRDAAELTPQLLLQDALKDASERLRWRTPEGNPDIDALIDALRGQDTPQACLMALSMHAMLMNEDEPVRWQQAFTKALAEASYKICMGGMDW